jgi:hypothetical protein
MPSVLFYLVLSGDPRAASPVWRGETTTGAGGRGLSIPEVSTEDTYLFIDHLGEVGEGVNR